MNELTLERLKELYVYDSEKGVFLFTCDRGKCWKGKIAGTLGPDNRVRLAIDGRKYLNYRLAWFYTYGEWPTNGLDHINGDSSDDRIINLRDVTASENSQNMRRAFSTSKTNLLGVSPSRGQYIAMIMVKGEQKFLGRFTTAEEAHKVYLENKRELHKGCTI